MSIRFSNPKLLPINLKIAKVEKEIEIARAFHELLELTASAGPLVEEHQRDEVACVRFLRILAFAANLCASSCHV